MFRGLSFTAAPGEMVLVTGPNGSGKTTLLRALAGLTRPAAGTVTWNGTTDELAGCRAYLGHAAGWKDNLTVTENLHLGWQLDAETAAGDELAATYALERVGLARQRNLAVARLSQGQRKRLHMARLSRSTRPLWLLDEPAAALDEQGLNVLADLVTEHLERGGTAAVATHQPLLVALARTQNVVLAG